MTKTPLNKNKEYILECNPEFIKKQEVYDKLNKKCDKCLDPEDLKGVRKIVPWNKNKSVGQKKGLTPRQSEMLREILTNKEQWMELALFNVVIDTMLRSCDLLELKVGDVLDWKGNVKDEINVKQGKTKRPNVVYLYENSKKSVKKWIDYSKKYEDDYLFTATVRSGKIKRSKMSYGKHRLIIKEWAKYLHLDPRDFSTHSGRRTRAQLIYKETKNIEAVRISLGQTSIESTKSYLGVDRKDALEINSKFVI